MKYTVLLTKPSEKEYFEKEQNNVAVISVTTKTGKNITNDCLVTIVLNKDAMLGLGKSLIRFAYEKDKVGPLHFYKIESNSGVIQTLGICLAPESAEPIIGKHVDKPIFEYLNKGSI